MAACTASSAPCTASARDARRSGRRPLTATAVPPAGAAAQPAASRGAPLRRRLPLQHQQQRRRCSASSSTSLSTVSDYDVLQQHTVLSAASGEEVALTSLWQAQPGTRCVVACLTHFGDLSSTECAQKLLAVLPEVRGGGVAAAAAGPLDSQPGRTPPCRLPLAWAHTSPGAPCLSKCQAPTATTAAAPASLPPCS